MGQMPIARNPDAAGQASAVQPKAAQMDLSAPAAGGGPYEPQGMARVPQAAAGVAMETTAQSRRDKLAALAMKYRGQLRPAGIGGAGARVARAAQQIQNSPYGYIQQQTQSAAGPPPWNPMKAHVMGQIGGQ